MIEKKEKRQHYRWLRELAVQSDTLIRLVVGIGTISGILLVFQAYLLAKIIQKITIFSVTSTHVLLPLCLFFSLALVRAGLLWLREIVSCKAALRVKTNLREKLMGHLFTLGPLTCANMRSGALTTLIMEQVEALHNFIAYYLPQMSLAVFLPLTILVFIFPVNGLSGFILLLTAPLIPLFMALVGMGAEAKHQKYFASLARLGAHFLDTLQGLTTLKLFGQSQSQTKRIESVTNQYRLQTMMVLRIAFLSSAVLEMFASISIALLAVYLGLALLGQIHWGIGQGGMALQHAFFILLLAPEFYLPLRQLATHYHAKAEAVASAHEISQLLAMKKTSVGADSLFHATKIALQINNVSFSYSADNPILQNVNLSIAAGESIAITGHSGSGKSTLLHLLMKWLLPTKGDIWVNQNPLADIDQITWLDHISWIGQHTRLFPGTLRENILLAKPQASSIELEKALLNAQCDFVFDLTQQLDTVVGEGNLGLSSGQVQRIALARAFLKNAPLLLLDEPTANLDAENEEKIILTLSQLSRNKTVVMVTHRESLLLLATQIYNIQDGRLEKVEDSFEIYA